MVKIVYSDSINLSTPIIKKRPISEALVMNDYSDLFFRLALWDLSQGFYLLGLAFGLPFEQKLDQEEHCKA